MRIARDTVVTLRQRVSSSDGTVLDGGDVPVRYIHGGHGGIFAKIEAALDGKAVGDRIQVTLAPEEAFGVPDDANHPFAGITLTFSATVEEVRAATPEEVAAEVEALARVVAEAKAAERALAHAAAEAEAAALARAEAADLVETIHVPRLGARIRLVFRSQTHKLCWLAPLFLLPAAAAWLAVAGWMVACGGVLVLWMAWTFFAPAVIRAAIDRWGYRFLVFDFSPNLTPSTCERRIAVGGQVATVLAVLALTVLGLFRLDTLSDLWGLFGALLVAMLALTVVLVIEVPFLVMILTAFRVRPVIDKAPAIPPG